MKMFHSMIAVVLAMVIASPLCCCARGAGEVDRVEIGAAVPAKCCGDEPGESVPPVDCGCAVAVDGYFEPPVEAVVASPTGASERASEDGVDVVGGQVAAPEALGFAACSGHGPPRWRLALWQRWLI